MSMLSIKLSAARSSPAWQLVLDKLPLQGGNLPTLVGKKILALEPATQSQRVAGHWQSAIQAKTAWLDSLEKQHGEHFLRVSLINSSRLLLHLGRASILENVGLYADRITGLPIIPGSAVKGVLSTWACWAEHFNEADGSFRDFTDSSIQRKNFTGSESKLASQIFGDNSAVGSTSAGEIVFLGAFPAKPPVLELDIVTPHTNASGNDQNPIPNPFLAIAPGTAWSFAFLAKPRSGADPKVILDRLQTWLMEAFEQFGIGAKTASGYGRFLSVQSWNKATLSAGEQKALAENEKEQREQKARLKTMQEERIGDYANETIFSNMVLKHLNPGSLQKLQQEIDKLKKPENEPWRSKLTEALKGKEMKNFRKKLKEKDWFPREWLPQ